MTGNHIRWHKLIDIAFTIHHEMDTYIEQTEGFQIFPPRFDLCRLEVGKRIGNLCDGV